MYLSHLREDMVSEAEVVEGRERGGRGEEAGRGEGGGEEGKNEGRTEGKIHSGNWYIKFL